MNDLTEAPMIAMTQKDPRTLPVVFINREGEPETGTLPAPPAGEEAGDRPAYIPTTGVNLSPKAVPLALSTAMNRLHRALFETGQLIVTTEDELVRVCFAGIGDPERLFIEAVPRDVAVPSMDGCFPGCLCTLPQAEVLLRRIYRGESSQRIETTLRNLALGGVRRRGPATRRFPAAA